MLFFFKFYTRALFKSKAEKEAIFNNPLHPEDVAENVLGRMSPNKITIIGEEIYKRDKRDFGDHTSIFFEGKFIDIFPLDKFVEFLKGLDPDLDYRIVFLSGGIVLLTSIDPTSFAEPETLKLVSKMHSAAIHSHQYFLPFKDPSGLVLTESPPFELEQVKLCSKQISAAMHHPHPKIWVKNSTNHLFNRESYLKSLEDNS